MPEYSLKNIVKVTQEQYDILANGGTVGDYTGIDNSNIYLVEDSSSPGQSITYTLSISGNVITLTGSDGSTSPITLPIYNGGVS